jgi:hypothetical protein
MASTLILTVCLNCLLFVLLNLFNMGGFQLTKQGTTISIASVQAMALCTIVLNTTN